MISMKFIRALLRFVLLMEMRVYDRWGALVFEQSPSQEVWDGRSKGVLLSQGVYVVSAKVTYIDGRVELLQGAVSLLR